MDRVSYLMKRAGNATLKAVKEFDDENSFWPSSSASGWYEEWDKIFGGYNESGDNYKYACCCLVQNFHKYFYSSI